MLFPCNVFSSADGSTAGAVERRRRAGGATSDGAAGFGATGATGSGSLTSKLCSFCAESEKPRTGSMARLSLAAGLAVLICAEGRIGGAVGLAVATGSCFDGTAGLVAGLDGSRTSKLCSFCADNEKPRTGSA